MTPGIPVPRYARYAEALLPPTAELLVHGGDMRIAPDPALGTNQYGCRPLPDAGLLAFGSSTASVVSGAGFAAADSLRQQLLRAAETEAHPTIYARELGRMRRELLELCGVAAGRPECVFAASGTDIHLLAAQLVGNGQNEMPLTVMAEAAETGSGVPSALAGRHFSARSALGVDVVQGATMAGNMQVVAVPVRQVDGTLRETAAVDAEVAAQVRQAVAARRRVLLVLTDVSKTGLIAPSPACVIALHRQFAGKVEVLVDACQFRLAPATLRAYLERGFMVALTGSKFVGGPSFSGALLVPESSARRLRWRALPPAVAAYSSRAEWPGNWAAADALGDAANFGLLLRWEAALTELRSFRALPETEVHDFLQAFAAAVCGRLADSPSFEALPVASLDRRSLLDRPAWDQVQTIFPFLLYRPLAGGRKPLNRSETQQVYRLLQDDLSGSGDLLSLRCQLGQPVACGERDGTAVSALRLCASARLAVEALQGRDQAQRVIGHAIAALDKAALIVSAL
jgi:hypothetical protein